MEHVSTDHVDCDVLVIGSGAGGLATALSAASHGNRVMIVEKASVFGGTTATSGGVMWVPVNHVARREGISDSREVARTYLQNLAGAFFEPELVDTYLDTAPEMLRFLEERLKIPLTLEIGTPDYRSDLPGALERGRSVQVTGLSGKQLGKEFRNLRPPLDEMTIFGMQIGSGIKLDDLYAFGRSIGPTLRVIGMFVRNQIESLIYGRPADLANGNALVARLWLALQELDVQILLSTPALRLIGANGRVTGALVSRGGRLCEIRATKSVVLASGGIAHDVDLRRSIYRHPAGSEAHFSLTAPGNRGDGTRMAAEFGARLHRDVSDGGAWMPVSRVPRKNGDWGLFLHSLNQGKPGFIAVGRDGRRFVDESLSYHDFVRAMTKADPSTEQRGCWLICDDRAFRKYGIGFVKPILPTATLEAKGYFVQAKSIAALATKMNVDPKVLEQTVFAYNGPARTGQDPEFGKGSHTYGRYLGDAGHRPNPNIAPLEKPPFRAIFMYPGDIGTFAGLDVNAQCEVLDEAGRPIPGLRAVGNDMASVFRGSYPGGGSMIGPAMTFGYLVGRELKA